MSDDWKRAGEDGGWSEPVETEEGPDGWGRPVDTPPETGPKTGPETVRTVDAASGADGWLEEPIRSAPDAPLAPTDDLWTKKNEDPRAAQGISVPRQPGAPAPKPYREPLKDIDSGKAMAIFSHCSIVLGLPVFIIPMITRDNEFALHHAKAAAANFGALILFIAITFATCGLAFPLIFLCYIPALVGIVHAANGEEAGAWGLGGMGESLFSSLRLK